MLRFFARPLFLIGVPFFFACSGAVVPLGGESELGGKDAAPTPGKPNDARVPVPEGGGGDDATDIDGGAFEDAEADAEIIDGGGADVDDADIDAGDASALVCGDQVCNSGTYCNTFVSGIPMPDGGAAISNGCEPLPTSSPPCTSNPTCASCGFSGCTGIGSGCVCDDSNGNLHVTTYGI